MKFLNLVALLSTAAASVSAAHSNHTHHGHRPAHKHISHSSHAVITGRKVDGHHGHHGNHTRHRGRPAHKHVPRSSHAIVSPRNAESGLYSPIWAGAVHEGEDFTYAEGTFKIPKATGVAGSGVAVWVGIDGVECDQALLQTGVTVYANGKLEAWYEWYPDYSHTFDDLKLKVGDEIKMSVKATSKTTGTAYLENLTTGQKVSQAMPKGPAPLCGKTAEWVVESFTDTNINAVVTLADFGTVTITDASANSPKGNVTPETADIWAIRNEKTQKVHTKCGSSGSSVTCKYLA
ncbi:hypothetical protein E4U21_007474 [Claviceps maximensis]|nr:hypothetical protein E4U21_007474 [Claviceps maximensis]